MGYISSGCRVARQARGAEAACSAHGSPLGWRNQSASADFHELRWLSSLSRHRALARRDSESSIFSRATFN